MDPIKQFEQERNSNIENLEKDQKLQDLGIQFAADTSRHNYTYNFSWMGRPIIQFPQDMIAMQELVWQVQPDLIVETGIAHGGSLVFYASLFEMMGKGEVLGIDIDIRDHNRKAIESHPMFKRITMLEGSSIAPEIVEQVFALAKGKKVLLVLDSNHTHEHVLAELEAYTPLVKSGCYCVVMDTTVEDMPENAFTDRPWNKTDNPKTAVWEFLKSNDRFEIDKAIDAKLLITVCIEGYLKCVKD